jgi:hypothetical protein
MIKEYFRRKKYWRFFDRTTASFSKILSHLWCLRKTPIFGQNLLKIAENCDHYIDP